MKYLRKEKIGRTSEGVKELLHCFKKELLLDYYQLKIKQLIIYFPLPWLSCNLSSIYLTMFLYVHVMQMCLKEVLSIWKVLEALPE